VLVQPRKAGRAAGHLRLGLPYLGVDPLRLGSRRFGRSRRLPFDGIGVDARAGLVAGHGAEAAERAAEALERLGLALGLQAGRQPVHTVRALVRGDETVVLLSGPGDTAERFTVPTFTKTTETEATETALLYGVPAPGQWCAVRIGARLHLAREPVTQVETVPHDDGA
jgi:hypothetical protein